MSNVMNRYHTEAEQEKLLRTVRQYKAPGAQRDAAWIDLLRRTGLRIGEFSLLTILQAKLALEKGWLFIPREHRKGKRSDHSVPVTDPIREALRKLIKLQLDFGGTGADEEALILSTRQRPMSIRGFQDRFALWCRRAGIEGSPHWMRHTRAMNIMRRSTSKDPRGIVQAALGHKTITSTGIYTRVSKEELVEELTRVDGSNRTRRGSMRRIFEGRA